MKSRIDTGLNPITAVQPIMEILPELQNAEIPSPVPPVEDSKIINLKDLFDVDKNKGFEFVQILDSDGN